MDTTATYRDIVFFGEDWGRHPSTAQFLAQELLTDHRVHWINSIGLREPGLTRADLARVLGKLRRAKASDTGSAATDSAAEVTTNTPAPTRGEPQYQLFPWIAPWHRWAAIRWCNQRLFAHQWRAWAHLVPREYAVITANPASYYLIDQLQPGTVIYYCADKYAQIAGLNPKLVTAFEHQLLQRVDRVCATSRALVDDLSVLHDDVHYLPHGVNFPLFHSALRAPANNATDAAQKEDDPLARFRSTPTVGFIGLLGEHIDLALLDATAAALPDTEFLCVGPIESGTVPPDAPNLHVHPAVPQTELPRYLEVMDVCILPYALSERNHYANPTKVREYLAAGRAVVTTPQPGLEGIDGALEIAEGVAGFTAALTRQLARANAMSPAEREQIAAPMRAETWHDRARQLQTLIARS